MGNDIGDFDAKLHEIEEQAALALGELPPGLTANRLRHIRMLARFLRHKLGGEVVAPIEPMPEESRKKLDG